MSNPTSKTAADWTRTIKCMADSRWKFHPWGHNAAAICERLESIIVELRLAELRVSDNVGLASSLSTKALLAAIQQSAEKSHG